MTGRQRRGFAILALFVSFVLHGPTENFSAAAPISVHFRRPHCNDDAIERKRILRPQQGMQGSTLAKPLAGCERDRKRRRPSLFVDTSFADENGRNTSPAVVRLPSHGEKNESRAGDVARRGPGRLAKRGGGNRMDRHLAAASTAALLAVGTASMGVATYALRMIDWEKYKKPAFKKGSKGDKAGYAKEKHKKEKECDTLGKSGKHRDAPGSPASPGSPQNIVYVTNNYDHPVILSGAGLETVAASVPLNASVSASHNKSEDEARPTTNAHEMETASGAANSTGTSITKRALPPPRAVSFMAAAAAPSRRLPGKRPLRFAVPHVQPRVVSIQSAQGSQRPHPRVPPLQSETPPPPPPPPPAVSRDVLPSAFSKGLADPVAAVHNPQPQTRRRFHVDYHKFDAWAPLAAKIEDYGKVSAATGAFVAGAISLYTTASEHNEYKKLEVDDKDMDRDKDEGKETGQADGDDVDDAELDQAAHKGDTDARRKGKEKEQEHGSKVPHDSKGALGVRSSLADAATIEAPPPPHPKPQRITITIRTPAPTLAH